MLIWTAALSPFSFSFDAVESVLLDFDTNKYLYDSVYDIKCFSHDRIIVYYFYHKKIVPFISATGALYMSLYTSVVTGLNAYWCNDVPQRKHQQKKKNHLI